MQPVALVAVSCLASLLTLAPSPAAAATIYRWIDEQGRTHYSEVVPEKYQNSARPVSPAATAPTPEQQRAAQERVAREKAQLAAIQASAAKAQAGAAPASAASAPIEKRPARVPDERTDCDTWARLYQESLDCFGPFRTARGATREEAFAFCTPVDEPPTWCRKRVP